MASKEQDPSLGRADVLLSVTEGVAHGMGYELVNPPDIYINQELHIPAVEMAIADPKIADAIAGLVEKFGIKDSVVKGKFVHLVDGFASAYKILSCQSRQNGTNLAQTTPEIIDAVFDDFLSNPEGPDEYITRRYEELMGTNPLFIESINDYMLSTTDTEEIGSLLCLTGSILVHDIVYAQIEFDEHVDTVFETNLYRPQRQCNESYSDWLS